MNSGQPENMPPLGGLRFVGFGSTKMPLLTELGGGSKRRQDADIAAAIMRWKRYQQAKKEK